MSENISISVVVPAYNHEKFIRQSLNSVLNQTVPPLEIIVINDGSTDSTLAICEEFASEHPLIKLYSQRNQGAHKAINQGIMIAKGRYIAILNSDDLFCEDKLEKCQELLKKNGDTQLLVNSIDFIDTDGELLRAGIEVEWYKRAWDFYNFSNLAGLSLLNENFAVTTSNMVFRKSFWEKAGGFQALRYCHDLEFLLEGARDGRIMLERGCPLVKYRIHSSNTIKEDIRSIRLEIAAVIAQAILEDKGDLLGYGGSNSTFFRDFLSNKNLSELILFLIPHYRISESKTEFYENVIPEIANECFSFLR